MHHSPVSLTCALALDATTDALVSLTVTRAKTRNPMWRDVTATSAAAAAPAAVPTTGSAAAGVHVALTS